MQQPVTSFVNVNVHFIHYSDNASLNALSMHVQYWQEDILVLQSLLVCVCMYFDVCVRPCVGKCVSACMRVCIRVCARAFVRVHVCIRACVRAYVCVLNIIFCLNCSSFVLSMH